MTVSRFFDLHGFTALYLLLQNCETSTDSLSCMCTGTIGSELQQCMSCIVSADSAVQSEAQSSIDSWNEACNGNLSVSSRSLFLLLSFVPRYSTALMVCGRDV